MPRFDVLVTLRSLYSGWKNSPAKRYGGPQWGDSIISTSPEVIKAALDEISSLRAENMHLKRRVQELTPQPSLHCLGKTSEFYARCKAEADKYEEKYDD